VSARSLLLLLLLMMMMMMMTLHLALPPCAGCVH
jgi:hypothetical protein